MSKVKKERRCQRCGKVLHGNTCFLNTIDGRRYFCDYREKIEWIKDHTVAEYKLPQGYAFVRAARAIAAPTGSLANPDSDVDIVVEVDTMIIDENFRKGILQEILYLKLDMESHRLVDKDGNEREFVNSSEVFAKLFEGL